MSDQKAMAHHIRLLLPENQFRLFRVGEPTPQMPMTSLKAAHPSRKAGSSSYTTALTNIETEKRRVILRVEATSAELTQKRNLLFKVFQEASAAPG